MAPRAPDRPSDPIGQKHRQERAGTDHGHDRAGRAEWKIRHGAAAEQHQVAPGHCRDYQPRAETEPLVEGTGGGGPQEATGVGRPRMRREAVGDGRIGGGERGQCCDEEEAAGQKCQRRQVAKAVAGKDGWLCSRLDGRGHRSNPKPRGVELPSHRGWRRRRMAGRNRGGERPIDKGHLGVLSFQTRGSIQTLQAGLRRGGEEPRTGRRPAATAVPPVTDAGNLTAS